MVLRAQQEQDCIPVGCILSAAVAISGEGVWIPACIGQVGMCISTMSMHWAGGGCVSQHALGRAGVSQHALGRGCMPSACWDTHPPHGEQNHRQV